MTDPCALCGLPTTLQVPICDLCACTVANFWWKARSGRYLTWDNPPRPKPKKKPISNRVRALIYERDGFRCVTCGSRDELSVDHIVAESKGGLMVLTNLQTLCRSCNSRKKDR